MEKKTPNNKPAWVSNKKLQKLIFAQNESLNTQRNTKAFNPHKYFGGWNEIERSSIDLIQSDNRLHEMLEYETSNASMSMSHSYSDINESLTMPSVADELEPSSPKLKTGKVINYKIYRINNTKKPENSKSKSKSKIAPNKLKDYITPVKDDLKTILMKTKKYLDK